MLFSNGFSVEFSSFEASVKRDKKKGGAGGGKDIENSISWLVIQLTQVLMSRIVGGLIETISKTSNENAQRASSVNEISYCQLQ